MLLGSVGIAGDPAFQKHPYGRRKVNPEAVRQQGLMGKKKIIITTTTNVWLLQEFPASLPLHFMIILK